MDKKRLLIFGLVFFVVLSLSFIYSEGDDVIDLTYGEGNISEIGALVGGIDPGAVVVENMDFYKEGGVSTLTFKSGRGISTDYSAVTVDGKEFNGIISREGMESSMKLDESGEIVEAELHVNYNKPTTLEIGGVEVVAPPGSVIEYKDGKVNVRVPAGEQIAINEMAEGVEDVTLEGSGFKIYQEGASPLIFEHGDRVHFDGENYFILPGDNIDYKGVSFSPRERVNMYFDGKAHEGEASLSFGKDGFSLSCGDNPDIGEILFQGESEYYNLRGPGIADSGGFDDQTGLYSRANMAKRDLTASLVEPSSSIDFFSESNPLDKNIPTISAKGGYKISTGALTLEATDGRVKYFRNQEVDNVFAREIVINDYSSDEYLRFIQVGENSNMRFGIGEKGEGFYQPGVKYEAMNDFNLKYFSESPEAFGAYEFGANTDLAKDFVEMRDYIVGGQEVLNNALIDKYRSDPAFSSAIQEYGGQIPVYELEEFIADANLGDRFLTTEEITSALQSGGYEDFFSMIDATRDMTPYHQTFGLTEGEVGISSQLWGPRNAATKYFVSLNEILNSPEGQAAAEFANSRTKKRTPGYKSSGRSINIIM